MAFTKEMFAHWMGLNVDSFFREELDDSWPEEMAPYDWWGHFKQYMDNEFDNQDVWIEEVKY